jgi:hypothetical protein
MKYVVKYTKAAQIMLMQSVAGQKGYAPQVFGAAVSRTSTGLPRLIPKAHRAHIRQGSITHIKLWMTLLGIYRVLDFPGKPSISSIVSPGVNFSNSLFGEFMVSIEEFISYHRLVYKPSVFKAWSILSTSPTSPKTSIPNKDGKIGKVPAGHLHSILCSLYALRFVGGWGWEKAFRSFIVHGAKLANTVEAPGMARLLSSLGPLTDLLSKFSLVPVQVGKLAYKQEPAGKLRVFAMLDPFSQWILRPIHNGLFGMLRSIKQDATFDQRASVREFTKTLVSLRVNEVYSFDLTSATDRLPVSIQAVLISYFIGDQAAQAWISFLTDRWFSLPAIPGKEHLTSVKALGVSTPSPYLQTRTTKRTHSTPPYKGRRDFEQVSAVRYAVGQPMGAYSSWAMLALVHHLIVFTAWRRSGYNGKLLYLVLGDDVVIANKSIAECYLQILNELGAPINLSKSIVSSNGSFEFAKRFIFSGVDVSPISWREMFVARWDINSLVSLAGENSVKLASVLLFLDHGYKAVSRLTAPLNEMSRSMALTLLWFSRPGNYLSKMDSFSKWLLSSSFNVFHEPSLELKPLVRWGKQLAMAVLRSLKSPSHPLSEYPLIKQIIEFAEGCDLSANLDKFAKDQAHLLGKLLWTSVFAFYREAMVYDYMAARGSIQRSIQMMQHALSVGSYKAVEALDVIFEAVHESEKEAHSFDTTNLSEWQVREEVLTLNRCRDLKWALYLRKSQPNLVIAPRRVLRKDTSSQSNSKRKM